MYTQLGVMTKGTVIEVNVSELGMVTTGGKVVFGKYAQITNNPVDADSHTLCYKLTKNRKTMAASTLFSVSSSVVYDESF